MRVIHTMGWLAAFSLCGTASAATATVTVLSTSLGQNIYFLKDGAVSQSFAGGIVINVNGAQTSTLCADAFTNIALNDNFQVNLLQAQALDANDPVRGLRAAHLFMTQYGRITSVVNSNNSLTLNQAMAALQLAIWDIVHDGGNGLSAGRIRSSSVSGQTTGSAIRNAAAQYISFSLNYQSGPVNAQIFQHVNGPLAKQQLIGAPEPGSVFLAAAGLGALLWRKRRQMAQYFESIRLKEA
jgi:hypothetical protein